jgi:hypothetical protein
VKPPPVNSPLFFYTAQDLNKARKSLISLFSAFIHPILLIFNALRYNPHSVEFFLEPDTRSRQQSPRNIDFTASTELGREDMVEGIKSYQHRCTVPEYRKYPDKVWQLDI